MQSVKVNTFVRATKDFGPLASDGLAVDEAPRSVCGKEVIIRGNSIRLKELSGQMVRIHDIGIRGSTDGGRLGDGVRKSAYLWVRTW